MLVHLAPATTSKRRTHGFVQAAAHTNGRRMGVCARDANLSTERRYTPTRARAASSARSPRLRGRATARAPPPPGRRRERRVAAGGAAARRRRDARRRAHVRGARASRPSRPRASRPSRPSCAAARRHRKLGDAAARRPCRRGAPSRRPVDACGRAPRAAHVGQERAVRHAERVERVEHVDQRARLRDRRDGRSHAAVEQRRQVEHEHLPARVVAAGRQRGRTRRRERAGRRRERGGASGAAGGAIGARRAHLNTACGSSASGRCERVARSSAPHKIARARVDGGCGARPRLAPTQPVANRAQRAS